MALESQERAGPQDQKEIPVFPGGTVVKKAPANAVSGHRFEPWSGKIPHATEQLSP